MSGLEPVAPLRFWAARRNREGFVIDRDGECVPAFGEAPCSSCGA
jgi:hypothetical protein